MRHSGKQEDQELNGRRENLCQLWRPRWRASSNFDDLDFVENWRLEHGSRSMLKHGSNTDGKRPEDSSSSILEHGSSTDEKRLEHSSSSMLEHGSNTDDRLWARLKSSRLKHCSSVDNLGRLESDLSTDQTHCYFQLQNGSNTDDRRLEITSQTQY
jgi:hypothetical protein